MDLFEAIQNRRSIRNYEDLKVENDKIGFILEACRWSPSAGNRQPWEIIVVDDSEKIKKLAKASLDQMWITTAPLIFVVCINEKIAKGTFGERGEMYSLETIGMAIQNMMLASHSLGLGSCCVSAFEENDVKEIANCIENIKPVALITVGYPREEPSAPFRDDISQFTHYNSYGKKHTPDLPNAKKMKEKIRNKIIDSLEKC